MKASIRWFSSVDYDPTRIFYGVVVFATRLKRHSLRSLVSGKPVDSGMFALSVRSRDVTSARSMKELDLWTRALMTQSLHLVDKP